MGIIWGPWVTPDATPTHTPSCPKGFHPIWMNNTHVSFQGSSFILWNGIPCPCLHAFLASIFWHILECPNCDFIHEFVARTCCQCIWAFRKIIGYVLEHPPANHARWDSMWPGCVFFLKKSQSGWSPRRQSSIKRFSQIWLYTRYEVQINILGYTLKTKHEFIMIFTPFFHHFWWLKT
jgi:hypothetical protein